MSLCECSVAGEEENTTHDNHGLNSALPTPKNEVGSSVHTTVGRGPRHDRRTNKSQGNGHSTAPVCKSMLSETLHRVYVCL